MHTAQVVFLSSGGHTGVGPEPPLGCPVFTSFLRLKLDPLSLNMRVRVALLRPMLRYFISVAASVAPLSDSS